jgi:hypothetical protein
VPADGGVEGVVPQGQPLEVAPHEGCLRQVGVGQLQHAGRDVDTDHPRASIEEHARDVPGPTSEVQHPLPGARGQQLQRAQPARTDDLPLARAVGGRVPAEDA